MAISYNKKELEKKKEQKRKEKQKRKEERKTSESLSFDDMIAYVDENGVITNTPPDKDKKLEIELDNIMISIPKKEEMESPALIGTIEHFNQEKGYGFIKNLSNKEKYFFHSSNILSDITEGNTVTFELEIGQRGMNAINVILAPKP